MATISIIGTAGRKEDAQKLGSLTYSKMVHAVKSVLTKPNHTLVSGGAAYSDHIAVSLFLAKECSKLRLYLPCGFDLDKCQFYDDGTFDWRTNPGGTANYYHREFSKIRGKSSLEEIALAIDLGAEVIIEPGFFGRNTKVAQSDGVIALTFGNGAVIKDGGTNDTARKYLENGGKHLIHIDLHDFKVYAKGEV
jgi:hypothetical protein